MGDISILNTDHFSFLILMMKSLPFAIASRNMDAHSINITVMKSKKRKEE